MTREEVHIQLAGLLVAIGRYACSSSCFSVCRSCHSLRIGFVDDPLDDLLFLGSEHFGQAVVELGLFLLEVCRMVSC